MAHLARDIFVKGDRGYNPIELGAITLDNFRELKKNGNSFRLIHL